MLLIWVPAFAGTNGAKKPRLTYAFHFDGDRAGRAAGAARGGVRVAVSRALRFSSFQ